LKSLAPFPFPIHSKQLHMGEPELSLLQAGGLPGYKGSRKSKEPLGHLMGWVCTASIGWMGWSSCKQ
jgi:hypothetical protein